MTQPIPRKTHGVADYNYVALTAMLPELAGFTSEKNAALLCRALSAGTLASTVCTRAEWGFIPLLPFRAHLAIDFAAGVFALASPWLFRFSRHPRARNTLLTLGAIGVAAALLTQPEEMS